MARQEDKCGEFTIIREEGSIPEDAPPEIALFGKSDSITILNRAGTTIFSLPSHSLVGGYPPDAEKVVSCYDFDNDGSIELLTSSYPGGTMPGDMAIYVLGDTARKLADLTGIGVLPIDLDGQPPIELVGYDSRWKYAFTSGNFSQFPVIVIQLIDDKPVIVTSRFREIVEYDRQRLIKQLPRCLKVVRETPITGFDACHIGVVAPLMLESIWLGDWETFCQQSILDPLVVARVERCRDYILQKASQLARPTAECVPDPDFPHWSP